LHWYEQNRQHEAAKELTSGTDRALELFVDVRAHVEVREGAASESAIELQKRLLLHKPSKRSERTFMNF
jgi:hypothetical protein